jgi:hypothetical protein
VIVLAMSISALKLLGVSNTVMGIVVVTGTAVIVAGMAFYRERAKRAADAAATGLLKAR